MIKFAAAKFPGGDFGRFFINFLIFLQMAEYLQAEKKQEIFAKYGKSNKDTGSPESLRVKLLCFPTVSLTLPNT